MGTVTVADGVRCALEGFVPAADPRVELQALVRRHKPRIYAVCLQIVEDGTRAAQLTREVIRELYQRLPELAEPVGPPPWVRIFRAAVRRAFEAVRRRGELLLEDGVVRAGSPAEQALRRLSPRDRRDALERAASALDPPTREVVVLRYVENLPHRVIDAWLGAVGSHALLEGARPWLEQGLTAMAA